MLNQSLHSFLSIFPSNKQCCVEEVIVREVNTHAPFFLNTCMCLSMPRASSLRVQQCGFHPGGLARHSGDSTEPEKGRPSEGREIWNWVQFCLSYNRYGVWLFSLETENYFSLYFVLHWVNFRDDTVLKGIFPKFSVSGKKYINEISVRLVFSQVTMVTIPNLHHVMQKLMPSFPVESV